MNQITRILCQKYTDLTDDEISYLEEYNKTLQALANAAQADVFIDCRSCTGKSAIVVGEAKPQTVASSYSKPLLGMPMNWLDEPAMERSFRLGVPTIGRKAVSVPENGRVVQTVEPIFFEGRLIAVLIYEKKASLAPEVISSVPDGERSFQAGDSQWLAQVIDEAVLLVDTGNMVCACNSAARELYRRLGYVSDILGMSAANILLDVEGAEADGGWREIATGDCVLRYRQVELERDNIRYALVIQDITELRRQEKEARLQAMAVRELRHRMKNSIQLLASLLRYQEENAALPEVQSVLRDTAGRILSLNITLEEALAQNAQDELSLRGVLERVRTNILQNSLGPARPVTIRVCGDDLRVSAEAASAISLVVNELVQNAVKHAFPAGRAGVILIELIKTPLFSRIAVRDNGVGMDPDRAEGDTLGLGLVRTMVREKLNGELTIQSDKGGTTVVFDFIA